MNILVIGQHFPPETGGPPNRMASFAREFARLGHQVTVVTAKPNHPEGRVREDYRGGFMRRTLYGDADIRYVWLFVSPRKEFLPRVISYLSFAMSSVVAALLPPRRYDVVVASSPPLFVGLSGWLAARLTGARFVFDVRDLWPDVAVAMGELRNPLFRRMASALERFIYKRAAGISVVTEAFRADIRRKVGENKPVERVSNGTVPEIFANGLRAQDARRGVADPDQILISYIGNVGLAQGLEHVIDAAAILQEDAPEVRFLILGSGPMQDALTNRARSLGTSNVRFLPRMCQEQVIPYMHASDALLVSLCKDPIFGKFIPSKLFDSMAAGRPVVYGGAGEAREILERAGAGVAYTPEDPQALVRRVLEIRSDMPGFREMGRRGQAFVAREFSREVQAKRMVDFLERVVDSPR